MTQDSTNEHDRLWKRAYPDALREREEALLGRRPHNLGKALKKRHAEIGLALSGGGIRSATFSFGVIQALAARQLFRKVDILSTVSGGGYTGSLISRLFTRDGVISPDCVEQAIQPDQSAGGTHNTPEWIRSGEVSRWLRENGRYLAPNGSGDMLLLAAIILRNWLSVHVVLATLVLTAFVFMQLVRIGLCAWFPAMLGSKLAGFTDVETWLTCSLPSDESYLCWSPWLLLPLLIFVAVVVPSGWAYWLAADYGKSSLHRPRRALHPLWGFFIILVVAFIVMSTPLLPGSFSTYVEAIAAPVRVAALIVLASGLGTLCIVLYFLLLRVLKTLHIRVEVDLGDSAQRHRLSSWLKTALVWFGVALGLAAIDTLGGTVFVIWQNPASSLGEWLGAWLGGLVAVAAGARQIATFFPGKAGVTRVRPILNIAAMIAAVLLFTVMLTVLNMVSHGIAWDFKIPSWIIKELAIALPFLNPIWHAPYIRDFCGNLVIFLVLAVLSWFLGRNWPFLNNSTLLPLYTARLTRAYLGASNPCRINSPPVAVTQVQEGDDMWINEEWWSSATKVNDTFMRGAPLHLVNVTINETLSGTYRVQQNDRRGVGMAVGPAGISAGVRHHVVFDGPAGPGPGRPAVVFPEDTPAGRSFRMFDYGSGPGGTKVLYKGRSLTLGQWTGISGAAFSTGLGSRTSLGLSLITGFFNVRLGLWWDSGVDPARRAGTVTKGSRRSDQFFSWLLPMQSFLLDEFLSRFPGVSRRWWYLSDGGHFENTGAYELLRRRLPLIIIIDAAADPDYACEDLANIVRKARLDFGAEIEFLDEKGLDWMRRNRRDLECLSHFGSLEMLCRGPARAALAWVHYEERLVPESLIVYIKPTLAGDETPDITSYHTTHPKFPQQTTTDQFFEEAQWESYRRLGQFISERIFADGFRPYDELLNNWYYAPKDYRNSRYRRDRNCAMGIVKAHNPGRGRFEGMVGSVTVLTEQDDTIGIGIGLSYAQRQNPPPIGSFVIFKHQGFTASGKPRFPSL